MEDLLTALVNQFSAYLTDSKKKNFSSTAWFDKLLKLPSLQDVMKNKDMAAFDAGIKGVGLDDIPSSLATDRLSKIEMFISFQQFLYDVRQTIVKKIGLKETVFVLEKQGRIVSPGIKAFEYMGNNNLNIKESPNRYDLVFD